MMKASRFSEAQVIYVLHQGEEETAVGEIRVEQTHV